MPPAEESRQPDAEACAETRQSDDSDLSVCHVCRRFAVSYADLDPKPEGDDLTIFEDGGKWARTPYHRSFAAWSTAIKAGCPICCLVRDRLLRKGVEGCELELDDFEPSGFEQYDFHSSMMYTPSGLGCDGFPEAIVVSSRDPAPRRSTLNLKLKSTDSEPRHAFLLARGANVESSNRRWECIHDWLRICASSHTKCREAADLNHLAESWYPTRLLDVGTCSRDGIRLIESNETELSGAYTTLSHRWGATYPVRTTVQTLHSFKTKIPGQLPQTFSDAAEATRRIGLRYLWIDSLCIIQDDPDDWAHESALMHKVYRHAFCNISATDSKDESEGLFLASDRLAPPIILRKGAVEVEAIDKYSYEKDVGRSPLQLRGWVFQERILSPRILHFTRTQVYWECESHWASEQYPGGFRDSTKPSYQSLLEDDGGKTNLTALLDGLNRGPMPHMCPDMYRTFPHTYRAFIWTEVVKWYTRRTLSYPSDIFPALSGIAKHLALLMGSSTGCYRAGMWMDLCMVTQLAWYTFFETESPRLSAAPTWSWASIDEAVFFRPYMFPALSPLIRIWVSRTCDLVDAQTTLATQDPTGAVSGGWIILEGHMNRMFLGSDTRDSTLSQVIIGDSTVSLEVHLDQSPDQDNASANLFLFSLFVQGLQWKLSHSTGETLFREFEEPTYLILSPCLEEPGSYMRCGLAFHSDQSGAMKPEVDGKLLWETLPGQDIPSTLSFDPDRGFKIRIV
ncbi:heterokaryon incompatibility protein-domain-containing protein [Podospora conica]|nr:heterokaryon incompatibility protein-domain-containing protein [Schizothecium conicum]